MDRERAEGKDTDREALFGKEVRERGVERVFEEMEDFSLSFYFVLFSLVVVLRTA